MVRLLKDNNLESLEANINGVIREEYGMKAISVEVKPFMYIDYYEDGRVCNQSIEYVATILFG